MRLLRIPSALLTLVGDLYYNTMIKEAKDSKEPASGACPETKRLGESVRMIYLSESGNKITRDFLCHRIFL